MGTEPGESDLLVLFERQNLPPDYKEYYKIKRGNFFASIQRFPLIWNSFMLLDRIWLREFDDLRTPGDPNGMFPMILFINGHAKMRVSLELGFSGCMGEAFSVFRDAIESVAHGHSILGDASLLTIWLEKNNGKTQSEAFKDAFERHKKKRLFQGLDELYRMWSQFSEFGAHTTVNALSQRFVSNETSSQVEWKLNYSGLEAGMWAKCLFWLLLASYLMEKTFFGDFEDRLKFDLDLIRIREEFERQKEQMRQNIISRFNMTPPAIWP